MEAAKSPEAYRPYQFPIRILVQKSIYSIHLRWSYRVRAVAESLNGPEKYLIPLWYNRRPNVSYGVTVSGNRSTMNLNERYLLSSLLAEFRTLNDSQYIKASQRNIIIFDDLMSEAKCDQRIADLFTKGSHHRNISIIYLTQNLFPQGKACRDIALNTQYLVLFNNPIDRQQIATLARRIYPLSSQMFIKRFEKATGRPFGYLMLDLKSTTPEHRRLNSDIFDINIDDEDNNVYS